MINITEDLLIKLKEFEKHFGDIVPLRELPQTITNEELIDAINISIEQNENILPRKFSYDELDNNSDILI